MKRRLWALPEQLEQAMDMLEESEGELTPEIEELLNQGEEKFEHKLENIAKALKATEAEELEIKNEANRIKSLLKTTQNKIESIKNYIEHVLIQANRHRETVQAGTFRIRRQKNGKASLKVLDTLSVPNDYRVIKSEIPFKEFPEDFNQYILATDFDKDAIREKLEQGEKVPGCSLETGYHIRVR